MNHSRYPSLGLALVALALSAVRSPADPAPKAPPARFAAANIEKLPRFLSLHDLMALRKERADEFNLPPRVIDASEPVLPEMAPMRLAAGPRRPAKAKKAKPKGKAKRKSAAAARSTALAPVLPGGFAPVPAATAPKPAIPRWVRYPLEFQLCGIALGTRAVNKDRYNRIDRYGLFAMHGNPTAVVVPIVTTTTTGDSGAGGAGGAPGAGAPGGGAGAQANATAQQTNQAPTVQNFTKMQTPPLASTIFPSVQNGELPDWAAAITVPLDNNHVEWLYNRGTYAMGFLVDRLGYVDGIVCAGVESPIARTQLEDPVHTVKLGDDLRKVLFRYGYPDSVDAYNINIVASTNQTPIGSAGGAGEGGGGAAAGAAPGGAPGGAAGAGGGTGAAAQQAGNGAFQTFEVRYEQSYNIVFTIRYNRVVRMYIFGDPDFFNPDRDKKLRQDY